MANGSICQKALGKRDYLAFGQILNSETEKLIKKNSGKSTKNLFKTATELGESIGNGVLDEGGIFSVVENKNVDSFVRNISLEYRKYFGKDPDFYVTDYSSSHKTPGDWDIMDSGSYLNDGNTPPTYSAHERFYLGWLTPEILNVAGDYELEELQKSNKAYIITSSGTHNLDGGNPNSNTYYLLENRQKTGWDSYLPGHGLMISKTVYDEDDWYNNIPNNNKNSQGYDIIEADGKAPNGTFGKPGDLFPGTANVTSYTPYAEYPITDIWEVDEVIGFEFMGGVTLPVDDVLGIEEIVMIKQGDLCRIEGLWHNVKICCFDAMGRLLWSHVVDDNSFEFVEPQGFYLLQVINGDKVCVVKGVRN